MFLEYYGLREQPFGVTPDPRFVWSSPSHREALASLVYGIETGRGFVALIAKPGMGKTTLLVQLMERIRGSARTAFLFQSQGNSREFFSNLAADLGLDPAEQDLSKLQRQLNDELIRESQQGRRFVVIVDEAQDLEDRVLESVRMLSNFETPREKLIQIVLSGQPQLADKLMQPELAQLRQRVSVIAHLDPLTHEEVVSYVHHRLVAGGFHGGELFTPEALDAVADRSDGVPRNINNICFHALSVGFASGKKKIDLAVMQEVFSDLNLRKVRGRHTSRSGRPAGSGSEARAARQERQSKRPNVGGSDFYSRPDFQRSSLSVTSHARKGIGERLIWGAAIVTVLIWLGVFWDSASASSLRNAAAQLVSEAAPQIQKTMSNIRDGLKPAPSGVEQSPQVKVPAASAPDPSPNGDNTQGQAGATQAGVAGTIESDLPNATQPTGTDESAKEETAARTVSRKTSFSGREMPASARRALGQEKASPIAATGDVVVQSDISGGRITVNGKNEPGWVTPHILKLPDGTYRISVSKGGYSSWTQWVHINAGEKRWVMANLGQPSGLLVLKTDPPGMTVYIDGRYYGTSIVQTTLTAGKHTYRLIPPSGLAPIEGNFDLGAGCVLMKNIHWESSTSGLRKNSFFQGDYRQAQSTRRTDA